MEVARTLHDLMRAKACLQCVCRRCRHGALLFPMTLGEEHGWHLTVDEITQRLRCSKCFSAHGASMRRRDEAKAKWDRAIAVRGGCALSTKPDRVRGAFRLRQQRLRPGNILRGQNAMSRRKGELTKNTIDREWPYQVALPASFVNGNNYVIIHRFCRGLSICPRHQRFRRDDGEEWICYCFAERSDAEYFVTFFPNGLFVKPEERPRWAGRKRNAIRIRKVT